MYGRKFTMIASAVVFPAAVAGGRASGDAPRVP
jgi:hypothetical protein